MPISYLCTVPTRMIIDKRIIDALVARGWRKKIILAPTALFRRDRSQRCVRNGKILHQHDDSCPFGRHYTRVIYTTICIIVYYNTMMWCRVWRRKTLIRQRICLHFVVIMYTATRVRNNHFRTPYTVWYARTYSYLHVITPTSSFRTIYCLYCQNTALYTYKYTRTATELIK